MVTLELLIDNKLSKADHNMIQYRKATISDIPELIKLRVEFLKEVTHTSEVPDGIEEELMLYFTGHIPAGDYVNWLAEQDGQVISTGGICFYCIPPNFVNVTGNKAYILNVYTVKAFRRNGISKEIFTRLMREAGDRGICQVSLHATKDGRPLYEQFGFEQKNTEMVWGTHI